MLIVRFWKDKAGVTSVEYCLIGGIVSLAILLGTTTIGVNLNRYFQTIITNGFVN